MFNIQTFPTLTLFLSVQVANPLGPSLETGCLAFHISKVNMLVCTSQTCLQPPRPYQRMLHKTQCWCLTWSLQFNMANEKLKWQASRAQDKLVVLIALERRVCFQCPHIETCPVLSSHSTGVSTLKLPQCWRRLHNCHDAMLWAEGYS